MGELAKLSSISKALERIESVPEAKDLRDKAAAICRYAKQSRQSLEIQNRAAYVKLLCERKAGALLLEVPRAQTRRKGAEGVLAMMARTGITESTARRWQYLAQWPENELILLLKACNEDEDELTTAIAVSAARCYLDAIKSQPATAASSDDEFPASTSAPSGQADIVNSEPAQVPTPILEPEQPRSSPMTIEAERAARLTQVFDAACDLCRDCPQLSGWIQTMHKWQSKLKHFTEES